MRLIQLIVAKDEVSTSSAMEGLVYVVGEAIVKITEYYRELDGSLSTSPGDPKCKNTCNTFNHSVVRLIDGSEVVSRSTAHFIAEAWELNPTPDPPPRPLPVHERV